MDERHSEGDEKERATAQIMDSDTLSLSLSLSLSALSPWCTHVDLEQGCILAGVARSRERRGWIDGDGVCGGIKGYGASIAEQVQGLIGSGNGWSM